MNVEFAFEPGAKVKTKDGLSGSIQVCGLSKDGVQYLVRGTYHEQWVTEEEILTKGKSVNKPPVDRAMKPAETSQRQPAGRRASTEDILGKAAENPPEPPAADSGAPAAPAQSDQQ